MIRLVAVVLTVALGVPTAAAAPKEAWFAIVTGFNRPMLRHEKPLRFADNDALKYYEFLRTFTRDAALFTEIDSDSRGYPKALLRAVRSPRKNKLFAAFARMNRKIAELRRQNPKLRTRFFFVFSGHGGEDAVGGYLNILNSSGSKVIKLTKLELWRDLLAKSKAHQNHVIIDSCSSGSFVTAKSSAGRKRRFNRAWRRFLRRVERRKASIRRAFRKTTFFVSSDALIKSHEYGEFQGGVFTHELLSALKGAADVNSDGRISYSEIRAFLASANARAQRGIYGVRLEARMVVPKNARRQPFVNYRRLPSVPKLTIAKKLKGRFFLVDDKNHRYADFHKSNEYPLRIALLPRPKYYLYHETKEGRREIPVGLPAYGTGRVVASLGTGTRLVGYGERGPVEEAFAHLFEQPLQYKQVVAAELLNFTSPEKYLQEHLQVLDRLDASRRRWRWVFYGVGAAAAAAATAFGINAAIKHSGISDPNATQIRVNELAQSRDRNLIGLGVGLGVAAGAFVTAILAFGEERDSPKAQPVSKERRGVSILPGPGFSGLAVQVRY